jgi:hypothetical protein
MLRQWLRTQERAYWLVSSQLFRLAIKANNGLGFSDTQILFTGKAFEDVMSLSPMLIPVDDSVKSLPADILNQGIGLTSLAKASDVLRHLQSLLFASLEGEEVLFRFYDREVILPMLRGMNDQDRTSLLGNILVWALSENQQLLCYDNDRVTNYQYQKSVWWQIKPEHLVPLYSVSNHARALERRWWELLPNLLRTINDPRAVISQKLDIGLRQYGETEQAELYTLITLCQSAHISIESIQERLRFDTADMTMIKIIQESLPQ